MRQLAVDTSVALYWAASSPARGQENLWRDSRDLLSLSSEWEFALPAPALGEVLVGVPVDKRDAVAAALSRRLRILTYDFEAARIAADLWSTAHRSAKKIGLAKQQLKVDTMIGATALRWSVDGFCSSDERQRKALHRLSENLELGPPATFLKGQPVRLFSGVASESEE